MTDTVRFERSHDILIDARPEAIFDYVSNPHSWPEWLPSSHHIDSPDRPLGQGDTFHEKWRTRTGEVQLDWIVTTADRPRLWIGETGTPFTGKIVVRYDVQPVGTQYRYTRTLLNPARPKAPTAEMVKRIDEEAAIGLANIKRILEARARG